MADVVLPAACFAEKEGTFTNTERRIQRVRKAVEYSASNGLHNLRIGCEYVDLAGSRLAMIERYITRIERERKAKATGLTS